MCDVMLISGFPSYLYLFFSTCYINVNIVKIRCSTIDYFFFSLSLYSLNSTKYAIPKKIMKRLVLASVVTTLCLESCPKTDLGGVRDREVGRRRRSRSLSDYLFV